MVQCPEVLRQGIPDAARAARRAAAKGGMMSTRRRTAARAAYGATLRLRYGQLRRSAISKLHRP